MVICTALKMVKCMLNHGLEWDKWVLTNLPHYIDTGLTYLFLGRTSHAWLLHPLPVELRYAWVHTSGVTTCMAGLRLYHGRRNVRDRDYEYDSGISRVYTPACTVRQTKSLIVILGLFQSLYCLSLFTCIAQVGGHWWAVSSILYCQYYVLKQRLVQNTAVRR